MCCIGRFADDDRFKTINLNLNLNDDDQFDLYHAKTTTTTTTNILFDTISYESLWAIRKICMSYEHILVPKSLFQLVNSIIIIIII